MRFQETRAFQCRRSLYAAVAVKIHAKSPTGTTQNILYHMYVNAQTKPFHCDPETKVTYSLCSGIPVGSAGAYGYMEEEP